jgi:chromosome segregation ATPase
VKSGKNMNKKQKRAEDITAKRRHREEKRAERRASSHQTPPLEEALMDSDKGASTNGVQPRSQNDVNFSLDVSTIARLKTLIPTVENLSYILQMFEAPFLQENVSRAAQLLDPELQLKKENEKLRITLDQLTSSLNTQEIRELKARCSELEREKPKIKQERDDLELEKQEFKTEKNHIRDEFEEEYKRKLRSETAKYKKELKAELDKLQSVNRQLTSRNNELEIQIQGRDSETKSLGIICRALEGKVESLEARILEEESRFPLNAKGRDF